MRNFVTVFKAFHEFAKREELSANEVILFEALLFVFNEAYWPEGALGITNNHLLNETTFTGERRDQQLRTVRQKLVDRGLISCEKGVAFKTRAMYTIHWDVFMPRECTQSDAQSDAKSDISFVPYIYENKNEEKKTDETPATPSSSSSARASEPLIDDDDAYRMQNEMTEIINAAEAAGFGTSAETAAKLNLMVADYGAQEVRDAIDQCVMYGAPKLIYLSRILDNKRNGRDKPATVTRSSRVPRQAQYTQREYTVSTGMPDWLREMQEEIKRGAAP